MGSLCLVAAAADRSWDPLFSSSSVLPRLAEAEQQRGERRATIDLRAPYDIAQLVLDLRAQLGCPVHYHRGALYCWNGAAYADFAQDDMRAVIYHYLAECQNRTAQGSLQPVRPNTAMVNNVLDALRSKALVP